MSEKNMCKVCGSGDGKCGECGNTCGWKGNNLLRWLLGIIIITWVFSIGVRFGEMKSYLEQSGYGRGHMRYYPGPMLGGSTWETASFTGSTRPAGTVKAGTIELIQAN